MPSAQLERMAFSPERKPGLEGVLTGLSGIQPVARQFQQDVVGQEKRAREKTKWEQEQEAYKESQWAIRKGRITKQSLIDELKGKGYDETRLREFGIDPAMYEDSPKGVEEFAGDIAGMFTYERDKGKFEADYPDEGIDYPGWNAQTSDDTYRKASEATRKEALDKKSARDVAPDIAGAKTRGGAVRDIAGKGTVAPLATPSVKAAVGALPTGQEGAPRPPRQASPLAIEKFKVDQEKNIKSTTNEINKLKSLQDKIQKGLGVEVLNAEMQNELGLPDNYSPEDMRDAVHNAIVIKKKTINNFIRSYNKYAESGERKKPWGIAQEMKPERPAQPAAGARPGDVAAPDPDAEVRRRYEASPSAKQSGLSFDEWKQKFPDKYQIALDRMKGAQ